MDPLKQELDQLDAERAELLKKTSTPDFSADDAERAETVVKRMGEVKDLIAKRDAATARLRSAGVGETVDKADSAKEDAPVGGGIGDRFVASKAYKGFKDANPLGVDGKPVTLKTEVLGPLVATKAVGDGAPLGTGAGGAIVYERLPGIVDLSYPKRPTLLDFITRGTTASAYLEYRQLISVTNNAAVVPEGELKPLSKLTTAKDSAIAHVIADGIKVTNQELADDGVISTLLNTTLTRNIWSKVEDLILNGTGTNEPRGILNTTGILDQAFDTDLVTTIRRAITLLEETSDTETSVVLLNPRDAERLDLLKDDVGRYYGNGPFGSGPGTIWGRARATSSKIAEGTALMGDLSSVHLLEREGLKVEAFNQNEDDARHNLTYIRAEVRELLLIREPARLLVAHLSV